MQLPSTHPAAWSSTRLDFELASRLGAPTLVLLLGLCLPVSADTLTTQMAGCYVESVTSAGQTLEAWELSPGTSSGEAFQTAPAHHDVVAADGLNLESYFARSSEGPEWDVSIGSWTDTNGSGHDFFVFEVGGNDAIRVSAGFPDGTWGQSVPITGWTPTGYEAAAGLNAGQMVHGLAFSSHQLLHPDGSMVGPAEVLTAIRIESSGIDGAAFLFVDPDPFRPADGDGSVEVSGSLRKWRPVTLDFKGPWAAETDTQPNPFLDYRLQVRFTSPTGEVYIVPGFFDGDGQGSGTGHVWRTRFSPDSVGTWSAVARFRQGPGVAVELPASAGSPGMLHGVSTQFEVSEQDPTDFGFWKWGWLQRTDDHYMKFREGPYFIKFGANSPENLLAFRGFDDLVDSNQNGSVHAYEPHISDWNHGDPYFDGNGFHDDSRGLIGAINYLSANGVNSVFAMLMNLGGDSQDVHPFLGVEKNAFNKTHYDISRMRQWNTVFEHAASKGVAMHFGLGETETANEWWLDDSNLGVERKLFYREMVARFAHIPALKWTLCEENDYSDQKLRDFAQYISIQDVYDHTITFHNHPNQLNQYGSLAGDERFGGTSCQYTPDLASDQVEALRLVSSNAGHPWVVEMDENNPWQTGLTDSNAADLRKRVLYDVLLSGAGIEWYMGWFTSSPGGDLTLEDFQTRADMWRYMRHARKLLEMHLPFWMMQPDDSLLTGESGAYGGGEVFVRPGKFYAVYLPSAGNNPQLDLGDADGVLLRQRWWNPRTGFLEGPEVMLTGGGVQALGSPPSSPTEDWVVLVSQPITLIASHMEMSVSAGDQLLLDLDAGTAHGGREYLVLGSFTGTTGMNIGGLAVPLTFDRYTRICIDHPNTGPLVNTNGTLDSNGRAFARVAIHGGWAPFIGTSLHHAYVLLTPQLDFSSISVSTLLLP